MTEVHEIQKRMNDVLDSIIQNAKKMLDLSDQDITQEEVLALQKNQDALLEKLQADDEILSKFSKKEHNPAFQKAMNEKLQEFQSLNQQFITNISNKYGLLDFNFKENEEQKPSKKMIPKKKAAKLK